MYNFELNEFFFAVCLNWCKPLANLECSQYKHRHNLRDKQPVDKRWIECNLKKKENMLTTDFDFLYWHLTRKILFINFVEWLWMCGVMPSKCMYDPGFILLLTFERISRLMYWKVTNEKKSSSKSIIRQKRKFTSLLNVHSYHSIDSNKLWTKRAHDRTKSASRKKNVHHSDEIEWTNDEWGVAKKKKLIETNNVKLNWQWSVNFFLSCEGPKLFDLLFDFVTKTFFLSLSLSLLCLGKQRIFICYSIPSTLETQSQQNKTLRMGFILQLKTKANSPKWKRCKMFKQG